MLRALRHTIITGLLLCCTLAAIAQYKVEKAIIINKENGLPSNDIRAITKTSDGFMWLGTTAGLCRFDGSQVKIFDEGKDLKHSLFHKFINCLLPANNKLWIGTRQGVSVLNLHDYTFRHYQFTQKGKADSLKNRFDQSVLGLFFDRQGKLWMGTAEHGLAVYDEAKDNFHFYAVPAGKYAPLVPSLGSAARVLSITQSQNNDSLIWAGTAGGLIQVNKYSGNVELFTYPKESKDYQIALNAFRRLYHHKEDNLLYVGSWAAGINVFDPLTKTFVPLTAKSDAGKKIVTDNIGGLRRKSDHEIWINSLLGLSVYDTKEKDITWSRLSNQQENRYYALEYIDESSRLWHSDINGLNYFDPVVQQFASFSFKQLNNERVGIPFLMLSDKTGDVITVCPRATDGIVIFNKPARSYQKIKFPANKDFTNEKDVVKGFTEISSGEYVIATDESVFRYNIKSNTLNKVTVGFPFGPTRRSNTEKDIYGNIWLSDATWGLTKWQPSANTFTNYKNQLLTGDTSASPLNFVANIFADSKGNIWFQRNGGIGVYVAAKDTIYNFLYDKNENNSFPNANSFAEDRKGRIWVSSYDNWIGYAEIQNPERGVTFKLYITDKNVNGFLERLAADKNGDVWGYTDKELFKINADNLSVSTYSFEYGAKDADFFHFSFLPSGEMILGGRTDITIANPDELKRNTELPVPYVAEVLVLNQPFAYTVGEPLHLSHKQNFFSIGFSAKAYTMGKEVKFRYRLKGFDDWSETTARRFANYTNVPGGDYVFQLQAMNNEGIWNDKILELPVHVDTPFWETWWFRLLVIIGIAAVVFPLYNYRENVIRKKEQIKAAYEKKIANVEMSSLLAQMNPHFLFNSLNSIDSYIIKNDTRKASEYLNNFARLMRLILQNSRSNYISLKDELEALELYMQMESLRFNDKFEYSIHVEENINTAAVSMPPMLIQPYVENAIWHGLMHKSDGVKGKVDINIKIEDYKLKCMVQDNGIGRGKAEEIKSQKTGNHKRSMGMQITSDRIEMINKLYGTDTKVAIKDLYDNNGEASGTRVELIIPV